MSNQRMIIVLTLIGVTAIAALIFFASQGIVWPLLLLFSVWSLLCVVLGFGLCYWIVVGMSDREQKNFTENAKENMALVSAIQSVQNKQNQTIMSQLGQATRLDKPNGGLLLDSGLFDDLED